MRNAAISQAKRITFRESLTGHSTFRAFVQAKKSSPECFFGADDTSLPFHRMTCCFDVSFVLVLVIELKWRERCFEHEYRFAEYEHEYEVNTEQDLPRGLVEVGWACLCHRILAWRKENRAVQCGRTTPSPRLRSGECFGITQLSFSLGKSPRFAHLPPAIGFRPPV